MIASINYMINMIHKYIKLLESSPNVNNVSTINYPTIENVQETYGERPAFTGSRGKVSGISTVNNTHYNYYNYSILMIILKL